MNRIVIVFAFVLAFTLPTFAATTQAPEHLSKTQLAALIASAKTPAEHQRIATYYRAESDRLLTESNEHAKMAADFRSNPATNNDKFVRSTVKHCEYQAQSLKAQAGKALILADEHERMAQVANGTETSLPASGAGANR